MKLAIASLLLACVSAGTSACLAQVEVAGGVTVVSAPKVSATIEIGQVAILRAKAPSYWSYTDFQDYPEFEGGSVLVIPSGTQPRIIKVEAVHTVAGGGKPTGEKWYVEVVDHRPTPPDPKPPKPDDPPKPTPILPGPGLKVAVVYESADLAKLPTAQRSLITSVPVRNYLNSKKATYRFFDPDEDFSADDAVWKAAAARPRASLPWIIISSETSGFEGPLPADEKSLMELLKKYGG